MQFKEAVSKRIIELCNIHNITPNKLAELSAIPSTTFNSLINCRVTNPSSYLIYKICKTLNIEIYEFYKTPLFNKNNFED